MLKDSDLSQLKKKGISPKVFEQQLLKFKQGFPYPNIIDAATTKKGIRVLDLKEKQEALDLYSRSKDIIVKFVPASGAASRMFKDVFECRENLMRGEYPANGSPAAEFLDNILSFPFFDKPHLLNFILNDEALGYGSKPKGLVIFHKYRDEYRTAFEEHLVEGALYAKNHNNRVNILFTVSAEHLIDFKKLYASVKEKYEKRFNCVYSVLFTTQLPSTDIIAVDMKNKPFVDENGKLLFRPGGHGALLGRLDSLNVDIIIVKNIDNVTRESHIGETVEWKKILSGRAMKLKKERDSHFLMLKTRSRRNEKNINDAKEFLKREFCVEIPAELKGDMLADVICEKLNRPIRVCGMVKNVGEPGGGPFIVMDKDGCTSLQILEQTQIDKDNANSAAALSRSTHFNPVDLVCAVRNHNGVKYNLKKFTDPSAGLIAIKSYKGRKLKAQELPGLWNGSMSNWNTQFVEVPISTFNPVKTVIDLLRPMHCDD